MAAQSLGEDPVWQAIRTEAVREQSRDEWLSTFLMTAVLQHESLEAALAFQLSGRLANEQLGPMPLRSLLLHAFTATPETPVFIRADLNAICDRDPVAGGFLRPFLFFKGFHALQAYRCSHWLWQQDRKLLAVLLQSRISEAFGVDIHPAAKLGCGILIDHATSVVIGETAVVEDDVSLLHEVTLGGTGKDSGDRHPKVRRGVLIGAGAKVLGNVEIGENAKIGAGSVVLDAVPSRCTVAGVPAKIVARMGNDAPALGMDQKFPHDMEAGAGI